MRRHSVVACLTSECRNRVDLVDEASQATYILFLGSKNRLGYGLGQMVMQMAERGIYPTETAIDLAILAATVAAADTRISRKLESQDSWTREIDLYLPVNDLALWVSNASLAARMLEFLTGDRWRLFFRSRLDEYDTIIQRPTELDVSPLESVCLFSGGLDSFVGAIDLLESGNETLFVSHYWDASTGSQTNCARVLSSAYGEMAPRHVRARVGFPRNLVEGSEPESTTRGRSFLFFALAALGASSMNGNTPIYVPENGFISLNVPLDPLRLGAWSTRTTHPYFLARWNELLEKCGIDAHLENPYRFRTKGEMLSDCKNGKLLGDNLELTVSCSSIVKARWKGLSPRHCGYCVPCLIRRAAIQAAYGKDATEYSLADLAARALNPMSAEAENIRSFQMMRSKFGHQPDLARVLVHEPGPLNDYSQNEIDEYTAVVLRGMEEIGAIINGSETQVIQT